MRSSLPNLRDGITIIVTKLSGRYAWDLEKRKRNIEVISELYTTIDIIANRCIRIGNMDYKNNHQEQAVQMLASRDELKILLYQVKKLVAIHLPSLEEKANNFDRQADVLIESFAYRLLEELKVQEGARKPMTDREYIDLLSWQDKFIKARDDLKSSLKKLAR